MELLVVLAIVAILASLLSTALNYSRAKAYQIGCLSNLRQLQICWTLYTDDNDNRLPLNRTVASANERIFGRRNSSDSWVVGNPKEDASVGNIMKGSLFPYTKSPALYRCPADRSTVIGQKEIRRTRSYSMSSYMNGDLEGLDTRVKSIYSQIVNPSPDRIFVFVEEHDLSVWGGSFEVMAKDKFSLTSGSWTSTPADWHNQGCNLSFADGSVEYWKWYAPKRADLNNKQTTDKNEFRDLRRLQECIPKQ